MTWLDGFTRVDDVRGKGGGTFVNAAPCGVIHTTEGSNIDAALSVYRSKMVAPHCTVDPARRIRLQHIPLDRSAYALVNDNGGVETNRHGVRQVEIVGFAGQTHTWPDEWLEWLALEVIRPISVATGITGPGLRCYGEDAGWTLATPTARQRLSFDAWNRFGGWCGHQHVPENSHWDPGALDLPRIVQIAQQGEDDPMATLNDDQVEGLLAAVQEINGVGSAYGQPAIPSLRDRVQAEARTTRRMTLDVLEAVSAELGLDPVKVRARLKPETRAALDKVD